MTTDAVSPPTAPSPPSPYGPLQRPVLGALFEPVAFPEDGAAEVRALAQRGTVVYVMRSSFFLHLVYLNHAAVRLGLPVARAVSGLAMRVWRPFWRLFWGPRPLRAPRRNDVTEAVGAGESALVFLKRPRTLTTALTGGRDPFPGLVKLQRETARPIFLVPVTLIWNRAAGRIKPSLLDILFGNPDEPGPLRASLTFLRNRRRAFVKIGKPVDLQEVVASDPTGNHEAIARRVRGALYQHLAREMRVVTGAPMKSPERIQEETLRDLTLRATLAEVARERGRADGSVEREAAANLTEIGSRISAFWVGAFASVLHAIFHRIYDGVEVDEEGVRALAKAAAIAPVVLCPSHKSHVDYLVMSYVLYNRGVLPPVIAAGDNLSFFPLGWLLRRGGAFFIRRSFKGDKVYAATLRAYVKKLVRDGTTQEFFVEGGRSRTGKLLLPKYGMVTMVIDAWLEGARPDVQFVPVSIQYEKLAEARSYERELAGGEKQKEDVRGLMKLPGVLKSRLGKVYISLDAPLSLSEIARSRGLVPLAEASGRPLDDEKRAAVRTLALKVVAGINRVSLVTPVGLCAAVLLSHERRGLSQRDFDARAAFLAEAARDAKARLSRALDAETFEHPSAGPLADALTLLESDGTLRRSTAAGETYYAVAEERRLGLDYHRSAIVHVYVAPALLCAALRGETCDQATLHARAQALSRLFKNEFVYETGVPFSRIVETNLALLRRWGIVEPAGPRGADGRDDALVRPTLAGAQRRQLLAALLGTYVETYFLAAEALALLADGPLEPREWSRRALDRGRGLYLTGRLQHHEALSGPTLESALAWLVGAGAVARTGEGKFARLELTPKFREPAERARLAAAVGEHLRTEALA